MCRENIWSYWSTGLIWPADPNHSKALSVTSRDFSKSLIATEALNTNARQNTRICNFSLNSACFCHVIRWYFPDKMRSCIENNSPTPDTSKTHCQLPPWRLAKVADRYVSFPEFTLKNTKNKNKLGWFCFLLLKYINLCVTVWLMTHAHWPILFLHWQYNQLFAISTVSHLHLSVLF